MIPVTFEQVYKECAIDLYTFVLGIVRNKMDAEDICADVFMRYYKVMGTVEKPRHFLFRCAKNAAIDLHRTRKDWSDLETYTWIAENFEDTESVRSAVTRRVFKEIDRLTPAQRKVLLLKAEGLTPFEIAAKLHINNQSVRNETHRAVTALRNKLKNIW